MLKDLEGKLDSMCEYTGSSSFLRREKRVLSSLSSEERSQEWWLMLAILAVLKVEI
jgi:hypothetical protein